MRQFPRDYDQCEVAEFLCRNWLPEESKDDIIFKQNGSVTVTNLDDKTSKQLIEAIHVKQNFGRKLYCNGFVPFTPKKLNQDGNESPEQSQVKQQPIGLSISSPATVRTGSP